MPLVMPSASGVTMRIMVWCTNQPCLWATIQTKLPTSSTASSRNALTLASRCGNLTGGWNDSLMTAPPSCLSLVRQVHEQQRALGLADPIFCLEARGAGALLAVQPFAQ